MVFINRSPILEQKVQRPWQIETFTLDMFPRCKAYLKGMGCNVEKYPIADYWAATILADKFSDKDFVSAGIDYMRSSGNEILSAIESLLSLPKKTAGAIDGGIKPSEMLQLMAFFGSRGVKTSMLKTEHDTWDCACILWPALKRRGDLGDMLAQIKRFSKAQRKVATANVKNLPEKWKS